MEYDFVATFRILYWGRNEAMINLIIYFLNDILFLFEYIKGCQFSVVYHLMLSNIEQRHTTKNGTLFTNHKSFKVSKNQHDNKAWQ